MLDVKQLTRCYGDFVAVDNVSFNIGSGEIVGLLGHNGAGKTTVMKMLSGYLEPDHGQIAIGGLDLAANTKQVQRDLGYLPENLPIYPDMVVADYLDFAARLKGLEGQAARDEMRRVVHATDIGAKCLSPIATLSRGFKQRVGVAQAILGSPRLLILDEPTNGLDPTQTEHMRQLIRQLAENATVILSTHIMQEVDALCDRVLILSGGPVTAPFLPHPCSHRGYSLSLTPWKSCKPSPLQTPMSPGAPTSIDSNCTTVNLTRPPARASPAWYRRPVATSMPCTWSNATWTVFLRR